VISFRRIPLTVNWLPNFPLPFLLGAGCRFYRCPFYLSGCPNFRCPFYRLPIFPLPFFPWPKFPLPFFLLPFLPFAIFSYVYSDRTNKTRIHVPVAGQIASWLLCDDRRNSVCRSCSYVSGCRNNSLLAMFTVTGSISPARWPHAAAAATPRRLLAVTGRRSVRSPVLINSHRFLQN